MRSRRAFLAGSGVVIGGAIAGCASLISGDEPEYSIKVTNYGDTSRTFHIRIGEGSNEIFHTETVELEGESGSGTIPFDGVPGYLSVTVGEGDQWGDIQYPWPVQFSGGAPASEAEINFWPERRRGIYVWASK